MSLAFLSPAGEAAGDAVARSPMERMAQAAGAHFEVRDGWNVASGYEREPAGAPVVWADVSHLRKWDVEGRGGEFGTARREGEAWVCPLTSTRALIVGGSTTPPDAIDVTCNYAALTLLGPQARETIARFCALDLRPDKAPPGAFRPGSIARQPGIILCEAENRYLLLFGWAIAEYMWMVVADAAKAFGGAPIGLEALNHA